jgi:radical SAM protein with 4Fe4S-binding SPASM domain
MKDDSFLSFIEGSYFVQGPVQSAVYYPKKGILYRFDEKMSSLFSLCKRGISYKKALGKIKDGTKLSIIIEEGLKNLDFVQFTETFEPFPSISDVLTKKNENRKEVWLEVTNGCNLRCVHCYAESEKPEPGGLTLQEWERVIDELIENGYFDFIITGGEPFFWPDVLQLLRYILKRKSASIWMIFTNGTLLNDKILDFLANYKIELNITFHSYLKEHHERISCVKGSWEKTIKGIENVIKRNIPYNINIPIGAYNQNDLNKTIDFLKSIGVENDLAGGNIVYPMGRGKNCKVLPDDCTKFNIKKEIYQLPLTWEGKLIYQTCWCEKLSIKPNGDVSPCSGARDSIFAIGNVRKTELKKIVNHERMQYFWGLTLDDVLVCRDCEFRYGCHDCRADAYNYSCNLLAKNPYCLYNPKKGNWMKIKEKNKDDIILNCYEKADDFNTHIIDNELAVLNEKNGSLHILNEVAAQIYGLLDGMNSFDDIVNYIISKYDVKRKKAEKDVINILREFKKSGIIK